MQAFNSNIMMNKFNYILKIILAVILINACAKEQGIPFGNNKVELAAITIDTISYFHAYVSNQLISNGNKTISAHGFCWSTQPAPDITKDKVDLGNISSANSFSSLITNLQSNQKYYFRAYATISSGTVYGLQAEFTTLKTGKPVVISDSISNISYTSAVCIGTITSDSGLAVTSRGVCWSTSQNPVINDPHVSNGNGTGTFTGNISELTPNTTYYIRVYGTNEKGTSYGEQKTIVSRALTIPTLLTNEITNIKANSATSGGNITDDGGSTITSRGVCWNTSPNPIKSDAHTTDGNGSGAFSSNILGLVPYTTYYIRAYASNYSGTAYGNQATVTTLPNIAPMVTTSVITKIGDTYATGGGNVTSEGSSSVTSRGVCWSTYHGPTTDNSYTNNGNGEGSFISYISGLNSNTLYYVRAYAISSIGTAYGNEVSFTTTPPLIVTDADGNVYNTVTIGTQVWMASNLKVTKFNDYSAIPLVTDNTEWINLLTSGYCWYNNDETTYKDSYGGLYNFYSVNTGKLCPSGWHVPTDAEWSTLTNYLGGGSIAGGKLKEAGYTHWVSPNTGATDEYGFSALPGGYRRFDAEYLFINYYSTWWSSSAYNSSSAWDRAMFYDTATVLRGTNSFTNGFSVRCIKD